MIISFRDKSTEHIFDGADTKLARKKLPSQLHEKAAKTLDRLNSAVSLQSLSFPGLRLEKLKGDRSSRGRSHASLAEEPSSDPPR